jgi:hypothetical protein
VLREVNLMDDPSKSPSNLTTTTKPPQATNQHET